MDKQPNLLVTYGVSFEINTNPNGETPTWSDVCAGFNNFSESLNEIINQYQFLCGQGFSNNYVTGMSPVVAMTGVRILGNEAQDYIFSKKYELMGERETQCRLRRKNADGTKYDVITVNCTLQNIQEYSGATTDGSAISVEFAFNGKPVKSEEVVETAKGA